MLVHLRKRRRQHYHAKKTSLRTTVKSRNKRAKEYKTKDNGIFTKPLKKARAILTIEQKLKVVDYWKELKAEKEKAMKQLQEPRPARSTWPALRERKQVRAKLRKTARQNIQKLCQEKFAGIVGGAKVCKWEVAAEKEGWRELPATMRSRLSRTTNSWRLKLGLAKKGRPIGGVVPLSLQRELDILIGEMAVGRSRVSERKEVVTLEAVVPCHQLKRGTQ